MATPQNQPVPAPSSVIFARGVIARLAVWPILRVAIQEGWGGPGGPAKRTWIASEIVDAFETLNPVPDDQYVEEMLLQIMQDEFDTDIEDGSAESVGLDIVRMWEQAKVGREDLVKRFEELANKFKGKRVETQITDEAQELSDEDEDGDEAPQLLQHSEPKVQTRAEPEVDEDGFTLVKRRK
jgi:pre-rRNA-processing protein TSR2